MNWAHSDFVERYRPLIYLISSEADIDVLAAEPGYTEQVGIRMKNDRQQCLRDYALRLKADFGSLYDSAYAKALDDPELAADLSQAQNDLGKVLNAIKLHMALSRFIPVPRPRKKSIVRRILLNLVPRIPLTDQLLLEMRSIQNRAGRPMPNPS